MKTRIVQTSFWRKMAKRKAPKDVRLLYKYLFTNEYINMCGIYELPDEYILLETGLTPKELQTAKDWLMEKRKVSFYDGWVKVIKAETHNNYKNGEKNIVAYDKEFENIPTSVLEDLDSTIDALSEVSDSSPKSEIRNHKSKEGVVKGDWKTQLTEIDLASIGEKYQVPISFVTSKLDDLDNWLTEKPSRARGRNLRSTLMAWVKRDAIKIRKEDHAKSKIAYVGDTI